MWRPINGTKDAMLKDKGVGVYRKISGVCSIDLHEIMNTKVPCNIIQQWLNCF